MLINSPQNARIKAVAKLLNARDRRKRGLFIVERGREIQRALKQGFELQELYWCPRYWPEEQSPESLWDIDEKIVCEVSKDALAKMVVSQNPQGVVGVFKQKPTDAPSLFASNTTAGLWLVTVGIEKPGNFGAMARTAEAAGCDGMLVVSENVQTDLYNPNAIRSSTGAIFNLPMASCDENTAIELLKANNIQIVTTSDHAKARWDQVDYKKPTAIVIGPEDTGLSDILLNEDGTMLPVSLPMMGQTCDSLNASVATGILLYEAVRQRQSLPSNP